MDTELRRRGLAWRLGASAPWLKCQPASGKLAPGQQCGITVEAAPPKKGSATLEGKLTIAETGKLSQEVKLTVHVVPPYQAPTVKPAGRTLPLEKMPKEAVQRFRGGGYRPEPPGFWGPRPDRQFGLGNPCKGFKRGLIDAAPLDVVYNIEGKGFTVFSAEVGLYPWLLNSDNLSWSAGIKAQFEVYVDDKLAAQSGLMAPSDSPRLLVATGLANAKTLRLKLRQHNDRPCDRLGGWGNPVLYAAPGTPAHLMAEEAEVLPIRIGWADLSPSYPLPQGTDSFKPFPPEIEAEKATVEWKRVALSTNGSLDLAAADRTAVYARVALDAEADCKAILSLGSRGILSAFVNGRNVFRRDLMPRLFIPDEDDVAVSLVKGKNILLLRAVHGKDGDALQFSLRPAGKAMVKQTEEK